MRTGPSKARVAAARVVRIESLDQEGRGVAHADGKVVFVEGALAGETVSFAPYIRKLNYEIGRVERIHSASPLRVLPRCPHFGTCGGCSMQHLDARAQVAVKQRILEDAFVHIGKTHPDTILPAIYGEPWGYRQRARFSARYVLKKGGALIGFRERRSSYVTDMTTCEVVPPRISKMLAPLREMMNRWSHPERVPQIELAIGGTVDALVVRTLQPPTAEDEGLLKTFADTYNVRFFLQPGGPQSAAPLDRSQERLLYYALPEFALKIGFEPTEFTQVNPAVNAVLVRRAVALLSPLQGERIADMFCGLGNFSLAIARSGANVVGIEGSQGMVARATANAVHNGLAAVTQFIQADLFKMSAEGIAQLGHFDRMLIDPPRDGAMELIKVMGDDAPRRIVYVSCNPATLARDAGFLVHVHGYALSAAGVVNMFPHTAHVESIAVFDRQ